jgi:flagellar assembly protein FliH
MSTLSHKQANVLAAEFLKKVDQWQPPEVSGNRVKDRQLKIRTSQTVKDEKQATAEALDKIAKDAYQKGLQQGIEQGRQQGLAEQQAIINQLQQLLEETSKQSQNFSEELYQQLLQVIITMVKQIIRRELATEPEQIMAVIREAIAALPSSSNKLMLKLHPEDAKLVKDIYNLDNETDLAWKIFEDPSMSRGGCIISTETSIVDMDMEVRIAELVNEVLGGERSDD